MAAFVGILKERCGFAEKRKLAGGMHDSFDFTLFNDRSSKRLVAGN